MDILIAATKTCQHRPSLEKIFQNEWLHYKVIYFEDHPELLEKHQLEHSPLLIVDEKVESMGRPGMDKMNELKKNIDISKIRIPKRTKNHMIPEYIGEELG